MNEQVNIKAGEPFVLPDGTKVLPQPDENGDRILSVEHQQVAQEIDDVLDSLPDVIETQTYKRTLADIPVDDYKRMNTTMVVLSYTVWGLDEFAISHLVNATPEGIKAIKETELYNDLAGQLVDAVRYAETSSIHGYIAQKARMAARVVVGAMGERDGDRRLKAAQDVLDRAGFRAVDRVEHSHKFDDELRIVRIQEKEVPTLDLTVENENV